MRLALALGSAAVMAPTLAAPAAGLQVDVEGVLPGGGPVRVALCAGGLDETACQAGRESEARAAALSFVFSDVAPGTYAVAAYQDLDGDGRLGRTPMGLPLEPYGLSNGAGRRGRPDYAAATFPVREPGAVVRIRLQPGVARSPTR